MLGGRRHEFKEFVHTKSFASFLFFIAVRILSRISVFSTAKWLVLECFVGVTVLDCAALVCTDFFVLPPAKIRRAAQHCNYIKTRTLSPRRAPPGRGVTCAVPSAQSFWQKSRRRKPAVVRFEPVCENWFPVQTGRREAVFWL